LRAVSPQRGSHQSQPEIKAKTATCERSQTCRLDSRARREAQLSVLQPSANPACRPYWASPMTFEFPMLLAAASAGGGRCGGGVVAHCLSTGQTSPLRPDIGCRGQTERGNTPANPLARPQGAAPDQRTAARPLSELGSRVRRVWWPASDGTTPQGRLQRCSPLLTSDSTGAQCSDDDTLAP
jgi:hypothetical protein